MARTADSTSSTEEGNPTAATPAVEVTLGRVVGVHGLGGALRVRSADDDPTPLMDVSSVRLGLREEDPEARCYAVARATPGRKGEVRLWLEGVAGRDEALALRGCWVSARTGDLAALPDGEYYAYELVGCRVFDQDGEEIGTVREIWSTGGPDLLVVRADGGPERLIPSAPEIMREVDVAGRRITIEAIPGLLEPPGG